ncbi:MAG TPA: glycerate kinase [Actinomycetota bacterium]|nr:glycerate kinase [Actinomycetota bacterium]
MRVLVAPDKFRGTLTAAEAAEAIASGWRRVRPGDEVERVPMADGGEGTLEALVSALGGELRTVTVSGPLGDPVVAAYGVVPGARGPVAVIEMARASGLALLAPERRDPTRTTTRGTGELIRAALERDRPSQVLVCIGGSATNDGGAGMAQALGARLLDGEGREIGPGGAALLSLARVDATELVRLVRGVRFVAVTDVDNPLVGPSGAAAVYGPQKGASPEDVVLLDRALAHYAAVLHRDLGIDVRELPGAGAAGGLGAGLVAFLGAHLRRGVEVVMEAVGLRARVAAADLVITGEGSLDAQSLRGKVVAGVLDAAREAGVPAVVLCGRASVEVPGARVASLVERFGEERAMTDARAALADLAAEVAAAAPVRPAGGGVPPSAS